MDAEEDRKWNEKKCLAIAYQNNFPSAVKDINVQKIITDRFLNFYLTGKVLKGLSVKDLIFAVISIMPCSSQHISNENFIWSDDHYSDNGTLFFLSPEDKLKYDIKIVMNKEAQDENTTKGNENKKGDKYLSKIDNSKYENEREIETNQVEDIITDKKDKTAPINIDKKDESDVNYHTAAQFKSIKWFRLKRPNNLRQCKDIQYGSVENAKFCISCNKLFRQWEDIKSRQDLKYFFGVTALVLMRSCSKSTQNLETYFSSKFTSLISTSISYSPPHKSCLVKTWKMFRSSLSPEIRTMFAKLIVNSFHIDKMMIDLNKLATKGVNTNIFKASVLAHASYYGMGIINMLQVIALHTQNMFNLAFNSLYCDETAESWECAKKYIDDYLCNYNEYTHHWARLLDPEQFPNLCCINNYKLAVVLAVYIQELTNSDEIWNSGWMKCKMYDLVPLKSLGYRLYKKYQDEKENIILRRIS